jgi:fluoroquinolone resistance protein
MVNTLNNMYQEIFKQIDFTTQKLATEYECCTFTDCVFATLKGTTFTDCTFTNCNLSNANIDLVIFNTCTFDSCKMVGLNFSRTKDFGFSIKAAQCNLSYTTFERKKLYQSTFDHCIFTGANFSETDLSECTIQYSDFTDAVFDRTNLQGIDFSSNEHFLINPETNSIKKAKFAAHTLGGLLYKYQIIIQ